MRLTLLIGGFKFVLDGILNVHASVIKYWKTTVTLWKCNVPLPFVGKTHYVLKMAYSLVTRKLQCLTRCGVYSRVAFNPGWLVINQRNTVLTYLLYTHVVYI